MSLADLNKRAASLMDGFNELAANLDERADAAEGDEADALAEASAGCDDIAASIEEDVINKMDELRGSYPGVFGS